MGENIGDMRYAITNACVFFLCKIWKINICGHCKAMRYRAPYYYNDERIVYS